MDIAGRDVDIDDQRMHTIDRAAIQVEKTTGLLRAP